jgi:putative membrane protein
MPDQQSLDVLLNQQVSFRKFRFLHILITIFIVFWIGLAISPDNRFDWFLENLLIWASLLFLTITYPRFSFSHLSYLLIMMFLALHTLGAHYSYRITFLDEWLRFKKWLFA